VILYTKKLIIDNLKDLTKEKEFSGAIGEGLKVIKPSVRRCICIIVILILISAPIYNIIASNDTIDKFISIFETSDDIVKNLFGITFTGYALFQALIGVNALKQMLINKIGKHSNFKAYNLYFFTLCIMYLTMILFNYIVLLIIKNSDIASISKLFLDTPKNIVLFALATAYIAINLFAISEIKSFLFNMYLCFNMSVFSEGIEMVRNMTNENNKKSEEK
jgi:hypothetical protein